MAGLDTIMNICLKSTSRNPAEVLEEMMSLPFCHMHGSEHHVMTGAALLAVSAAVDFVRENLGVEMKKADVTCKYSARNNQRIGTRCPFHKS